jgi:pyruvate,water dikinase
MEWCGRSKSLTVLQARPVTTGKPDTDDKRNWYLTLRPGDARLREMRRRVAEELIPQLEAEGNMLAAAQLAGYDDRHLADAIEQRRESVERWKKIYWDEFIPFAHGVRRLATYYNDAVQPEDPYEFVALLQNQPLIAVKRNEAIAKLAQEVRLEPALQNALDDLLQVQSGGLHWKPARDALARSGNESLAKFINGFEEFTDKYLDIAFDHERLYETTESLLRNISELARSDKKPAKAATGLDSSRALEQRLFDAVGGDRYEEARDVIETGRISWKLRDDDNLLVSRLESQMLRAMEIGVGRLRDRGRIVGDGRPHAKDAEAIVACLRDGSGKVLELHASPTQIPTPAPGADAGWTSRQLTGQPASPGIATGSARLVRGSADLGTFRHGEVLVCDAIQPAMTHLVPLASAIVERRGGMLIHGAIIARELGIPCVNGVRNAAELFSNGNVVTVDGYLGIVTLGTPELDLELNR